MEARLTVSGIVIVRFSLFLAIPLKYRSAYVVLGRPAFQVPNGF